MAIEEVRSRLERLFDEQLLGPSEESEVLEAAPSDVYLTGILWPRDTEIAADEDDAGLSELGSTDAESIETSVPGYRAIRPCAIGLTFEVQPDTAISISLGTTARYVPEEKSGVLSEGEEKQGHAWRRVHLPYRLLVSVDESWINWRAHEFLLPDGGLRSDPNVAIDIRRRPAGDRVVFTITLINAASGEVARSLRDCQLLFQSQLVVEARNAQGKAAIQPRMSYPYADDEDQLSNLLLYRDIREFAVGHGVAAEWSERSLEATERVSTSWLPRVRVKGTSPEGHESLGQLRTREPSPLAASTLADSARREKTCRELDEFCQLYSGWIDSGLTARLDTFAGELHKAAIQNRGRCVRTLERLLRGVALLRTSDVAWEAFALANRAMGAQAQFRSKAEAKPLVWRPFQLAFILIVIPGLVDPSDSDRDTMDLLWFPTGGGKTEAYLAISAFEIFRRRIVSQHRRTSGGIDVLMRYTLRLLTVQQFQRAAALICACDMIRRQRPERLGDFPISLGLYVGADSTPNKLEVAVQRLEDERNGLAPASTPRQILNCPACGSELPSGAYRIDLKTSSMDIACSAAKCEFSGASLPIMTVDEAIYAHPPSLLIGTIDKFAQLPRNERTGILLGCATPERLGLIIQDELHLISGPLGSMAGLYEAAVDRLCTLGSVRPKIIGSTATIGRAARQVRALFDRDVQQFPPSGFDSADSFFAVRDDKGPDRVYRGVASAGRSPKFALQALLAVLMQSVHALRESGIASDADIDPYWTCVGYFNSLRELGGAHVLMLDDVRRQMAFLAGRMKVTPRPMEEPPRELSSRKTSREIPEELRKLSQTLGSGDPFAPLPADAVLASNMISVGVDVPRLGLMAVAGQPKSTAEYIQATSRVGRGLPGLITTLYNFGRARDLSHFEHFVGYHLALYRGVEATSVTPWAARARDKALHAVFAATVRHMVAGMFGDDDAIAFSPGTPAVQQIVEYLVARAHAASDGRESTETREDLLNIEDSWRNKCLESLASGRKLLYWQRRAPFGKTSPHLMRSAEELRSPDGNSWPTPNSMREVEPSTAFVLKRIQRRGAADA